MFYRIENFNRLQAFVYDLPNTKKPENRMVYDRET